MKSKIFFLSSVVDTAFKQAVTDLIAIFLILGE